MSNKNCLAGMMRERDIPASGLYEPVIGRWQRRKKEYEFASPRNGVSYFVKKETYSFGLNQERTDWALYIQTRVKWKLYRYFGTLRDAKAQVERIEANDDPGMPLECLHRFVALGRNR
jgi:hypothetical protein